MRRQQQEILNVEPGGGTIFLIYVFFSVADPCHFGVDSDPDPRIHANGSGFCIVFSFLLITGTF